MACTEVDGSAVMSRRRGTRPTRWSWLVDDVDVEDALARHRLPEVIERLADRHLLVDGDELRRHDAARGRLAVLEEVLDLLRLGRRHLVEDAGGLLLGQGLDHVRRLVGRHLVEDAGDLALVERRHQGETAAVVHLVEDGAGLLRAGAGGAR